MMFLVFTQILNIKGHRPSLVQEAVCCDRVCKKHVIHISLDIYIICVLKTQPMLYVCVSVHSLSHTSVTKRVRVEYESVTALSLIQPVVDPVL